MAGWGEVLETDSQLLSTASITCHPNTLSGNCIVVLGFPMAAMTRFPQ